MLEDTRPQGDCSAACRLVIPKLDTTQCDRLALIVVRLDPEESMDPVGAYRLIVGSGGVSSDPRR